ncbi:MAG: RidA family protein [Acidimicrobiales bacterium]
MTTRQTLFGPTGERPGMGDAVKAGPFIMLAGQVAFDEHGKIVGEGDIRAQAEQCFRNIEHLLAKAGATMADLVELTCFLTNRDQLPTYLALRAELFPVDPPATTTVVAQLALPSLMIEIKGIALVRSQ